MCGCRMCLYLSRDFQVCFCARSWSSLPPMQQIGHPVVLCKLWTMQALRPCFPLCLGVSSLKLVSEYHSESCHSVHRPVPLRGGFSSIRQADGWLATGRKWGRGEPLRSFRQSLRLHPLRRHLLGIQGYRQSWRRYPLIPLSWTLTPTL